MLCSGTDYWEREENPEVKADDAELARQIFSSLSTDRYKHYEKKVQKLTVMVVLLLSLSNQGVFEGWWSQP